MELLIFFYALIFGGASVGEMNDATGKGSSCLAITEKKNQRVGGCIGVFFQLFDWNRSLTKKKLFKKLPPPAGMFLFRKIDFRLISVLIKKSVRLSLGCVFQ